MAKKHDPDVRVTTEIHERILSMMFPGGKGRRVFKSKNEVIEFLFKQYDEKIKNKINSIQNKDSGFTFKIPPEAVEEAGLNFGDKLKISIEGNKIILEKELKNGN